MSGRRTTVPTARLTPAEKAALDERVARLVPVTYVVIAGTPDCPTGSTVTMLEDPERLKKKGGA